MRNRSVNVNLSEEVWKIIDTNFKTVSRETDSEILCNIIKLHLASNGYYPDINSIVDSLTHGHGIKDYLNINALMIESIVEILDKKGLVTSKEFAEVMDQKMMNE